MPRAPPPPDLLSPAPGSIGGPSPCLTRPCGRFLLESLESLKQSLQAQKSSLAFRLGSPDAEISAITTALAQKHDVVHVDLYHHQEIDPDQKAMEEAVATAFSQAACCAGISSAVESTWCATLYHPADLPDFSTGKKKKRASKQATQDSQACTCSHATQSDHRVPGVMTDFRKVSTPPLHVYISVSFVPILAMT